MIVAVAFILYEDDGGCDVISPQAMVHLPWLVPIFCLGHNQLCLCAGGPNPTPRHEILLKKCKETSTKKRVSFTFSTKTVGFLNLNRWLIPSKVTSSPPQVTLETLLSSSMTQKLKQYDISMPKSTSTAGSWARLERWEFLETRGIFWCLFFSKSIDQKQKNMFWGESVGRGKAFNDASETNHPGHAVVSGRHFRRSESKSQWRHCQFPWTYSWRRTELNESTLNLDDFFCASSTKVWRKQLGLRRIELNLPDFWKWWCSLSWRRYKLTTPFHQTKCPTQLRSAHN